MLLREPGAVSSRGLGTHPFDLFRLIVSQNVPTGACWMRTTFRLDVICERILCCGDRLTWSKVCVERSPADL